MKKTSTIFILLIILMTAYVNASITATTTYSANIPFTTASYKCSDSTCNNLISDSIVGPSTSNYISYYTAVTSPTNPATWINFHFDPNACYIPKYSRERFPENGNYGHYNWNTYTFEKQPQSLCGSEVEDVTKSTGNIVDIGTTVTMNANLRSLKEYTSSWFTYIPSELDQYYTSKVNVFYKVYKDDYTNLVYDSSEKIEINFNDKYNAELSYTPTEPGTYYLRIETNMFDDCKCNQPSNEKVGEVIVTVLEPYCGDGNLDDGEFCDDGNNVDGDGCDGNCNIEPYCGDGNLDEGEFCDDGNNVDGDGCDANCNIETGCLDGYKYTLVNNNPSGVSEWEITLVSADGSYGPISASTSGNGHYKFENLPPGLYNVTEEMQDGWQVMEGYESEYQVEIFSQDTCTIQDFYNEQIGCLEGTKFDQYGNGLEGWDIVLRDMDGNFIDSMSTNETGNYIFEELTPGQYNVTEVMQNGWTTSPLYSESYLVTVYHGSICTQRNFVNQEELFGCINGTKRNEFEELLPGWNISIQRRGTDEIFSVFTDENGYYEFTGLEPGIYDIWEEMQEGWEAIIPDETGRTSIEIFSNDICEAVPFKNSFVDVCVDECIYENTMCTDDTLYICGDFDEDDCFEWGEYQNCEYYDESDSYTECVADISTTYVDIIEGFCNDQPGYNDYCDLNTHTEIIVENDCYYNNCENDQYCEENSVYNNQTCYVGSCNLDSGLCQEIVEDITTKTDECGNGEILEFCDGENIVRTESTRSCVEENNEAFCVGSSSISIIEQCGPDSCTDFTVLDPYTKEYVYDEESCQFNEYPYCAYDPGDIYDYCLNEDTLMQAICIGDDHSFEQFDCSGLDSCVAFTYEACTNCFDPYTQNCQNKECTLTGYKFVQNLCADGACMQEEVGMIDIDHDKIDDRCDGCIDVDKDGVCDDVDNCVGVYNPTQVDTDNDGYGNFCDDDKDDDGYPAYLDCDDWNPDVNPGAEEIKNNGRDDDCSAETVDKGSYTPRQALYVDVTYDETQVRPGKDLFFVVSVKNNFRHSLDNVKLAVSMPGIQELNSKLDYELQSGETITKQFTLKMPNNLDDFEYLRVAVSNDEYKRIIYRELKMQ